GWTMVKLRQQNARWAAGSRQALDAGARGAVIDVQLKGLTADLARGALLTALALLVFVPLADASLALWTVDARVSRAVAAGIATSVAAGAAWKIFHSSMPARWTFVVGLVAGLSILGAG
ncbi:MAG: hypothetical protein WD801_08075, partial [Gemmatimonadaceae bacterium]